MESGVSCCSATPGFGGQRPLTVIGHHAKCQELAGLLVLVAPTADRTAGTRHDQREHVPGCTSGPRHLAVSTFACRSAKPGLLNTRPPAGPQRGPWSRLAVPPWPCAN